MTYKSVGRVLLFLSFIAVASCGSRSEETAISYTIDRFEGDVAVLEDFWTLLTRNVQRSMLPMGAKEGDVLTADVGGEWRIEEAETADRAEGIRGWFERLRKRK